MSNIDRIDVGRPASEHDLHEGMDKGGVLFSELPPIDDADWKEITQRMAEIREAKAKRVKVLKLVRATGS